MRRISRCDPNANAKLWDRMRDLRGQNWGLTTLIWYKINRLMITENKKIIISNSSNTIIIIIFMTSLFRLIVIIMYLSCFMTIMTLYILVLRLGLSYAILSTTLWLFFPTYPLFLVTCTSDWDEEPHVFLLISSLRIPPISVSKK